MIGLLLLSAVQVGGSPPPGTPVMGRMVIAAPQKPIVTGAGTCLPIKLSNGLPTVEASIEGRELRLGFDTGSPGGPHIGSAMIDQLKLTKIGEARISDPSLKNVQPVGLYELNNLKLGGLSIEKWHATGMPPRPAAVGEPDGIIGLDAFSGYVVTIDYPSGRIIATRGHLPEPDGRTSFRYQGPIPRVPLNVDGQPIEAHVDTGNARYGLIVPQAYAAQLPGYTSRFPIGVAHSANNKYDLMALPVHEAKVGSLPLYAGTAAFPAPATIGNIGSVVLRDMIVKIDPANSIVSFERATPGLENGCPNA